MNLLISLFDYSGNQSLPYKRNGWEVWQVEIKLGVNLLTWDYLSAWEYLKSITHKSEKIRVGIIAPIPCTDYALSGARHFARKDSDGTTANSQKLADKTKEIIDFFTENSDLVFWYMENPMSRIHKLNPWMGGVVHKFNPCDYAGYLKDPEPDRYNKQTWLWGKFNAPPKRRVEPIYKENPGWKLYGGKTEKTKALRSITPMGFCWAFYKANH